MRIPVVVLASEIILALQTIVSREIEPGQAAVLYEESLRTGKTLPSLHSSLWAPDPEPTIRTGIAAMTAAVWEWLQR